MWFHKMSAIVSSLLTVIVLALAMYFEYSLQETFWVNVCLGVFGSSLLTMIISVLNYWAERKRVCESFWSSMHKVIRNFRRYDYDVKNNEKIDGILLINEFDYQAFDDAFGGFSFFIGNRKKRKDIYDKLYYPVLSLRRLIQEKSLHFKEYKKIKNGNVEVMKRYIDEVENKLIKKTVFSDGADITCTYIETFFVDELCDELQGDYYKLMYPCLAFKDRIKSSKLYGKLPKKCIDARNSKDGENGL